MADFNNVHLLIPILPIKLQLSQSTEIRKLAYEKPSRPKVGQVWPHSRTNARPGDQYITIRSYEGETLRWFTGED